jgi:microsomal dipeptidase-like Zn-dependent dipeptidase
MWFFPVKNGKELRAAVDNGKIGIILGMEGLSALRKIRKAYTCYTTWG